MDNKKQQQKTPSSPSQKNIPAGKQPQQPGKNPAQPTKKPGSNW